MNRHDARAGSAANGGSPEGPDPTDEELMLWVDGESDPHRAAEVEAFVAENPRARAVVAALRQAASLVESRALERASVGGADSIADDVMAAIDAKPLPAPVASVRSLGTKRLPLATAGLFAAAAAAALILFLPHAKESPIGPEATARAPSAAAFSGAVVDVVDFGARAGTIFYVPSDEGETAVVWVTEDETNPSGGENL